MLGFVAVLLAWLVTGMTVEGAETVETIRVGVSRGWGSSELVELWNAEPGFSAHEISRITASVLNAYDVLVLTQRASASSVNRAAGTIRTWVLAGGGVLCLHGSVGYQSHLAMFRDVGQGGAVIEGALLRVVVDHYITRTKYGKGPHKSAHDYAVVGIEPGEHGKTLIETDQGIGGLAIGRMGRGRVALFGIGAGAARREYDEHLPVSPEETEIFRMPTSVEREWLASTVLWLAGREGTPPERD